MNLPIPAFSAAALLAGAAAFGTAGESPDYRWSHDPQTSSTCTALLNGPGPDGIGPINASIETGMRDAVFFVLSAVNEQWPIAEEQHAFPIEIGFDGAPPRTRIEEAWGWTPGGLQFELDESVRRRLVTAQSMEFYRGGRRLGSVPTKGLGTALESIRTCAENDAIHSVDASIENAAADPMDMTTDMNATADPGSDEMDAVAAAERALDAAANATDEGGPR